MLGLAANIYAKIGLFISQFALVPIFVSQWGVDGYGEWVYLTALASYLALSSAGFSAALRSKMTFAFVGGDTDQMARLFQTVICATIAVTGTVVVVFIAYIYWTTGVIPDSFTKISNQEARYILTLLFFQVSFAITSAICSAALSSMGRYPLCQAIDATRIFVDVGLITFAVLMGQGPVTIAEIMAFDAAVQLVVLLTLVRVWMPYVCRGFRFSFVILRELKGAMGGAAAVSFGYSALMLQFPRVIIGAMLGATELGAFSIATLLVRALKVLVELPNFSATPELAAAYGRGDLTFVRSTLTRLAAISFYLMGAGSIGLLVTCNFIVMHLLGKHVGIDLMVLAPLCVAGVFFGVGLSSQESLVAANRIGLAIIPFIVTCIVVIVLMLVGVKALGLHGASLVIMLGESGFYLCLMVLAHREFKLRAGAIASEIKALPGMSVRKLREVSRL